LFILGAALGFVDFIGDAFGCFNTLLEFFVMGIGRRGTSFNE
jgi:hypothetical protein